MVKYLYDGLLQNKSLYAHSAFHQPYNAEVKKVRNPWCEKEKPLDMNKSGSVAFICSKI